MTKFAAFAVLAAASALAAPAMAQTMTVGADSVRIPVAGKTVGQLNREINDAATVVCGVANPSCYDAALRSAHRQLAALTRAGARPEDMRVALLPNGVYAVRVSLIGKSPVQLRADIDSAASAVCRPATSGRMDYVTCVSHAVNKAKADLHAGAQVAANN